MTVYREQRRILKVDCLQKLMVNRENEPVSSQQSYSANKGESGQLTVCSNAAHPTKEILNFLEYWQQYRNAFYNWGKRNMANNTCSGAARTLIFATTLLLLRFRLKRKYKY